MGASTTFSARYYDALVQDACDQQVEAWTSLELREGKDQRIGQYQMT